MKKLSILFFLLIGLVSCKKEEIRIGKFSKLPPEIDGCSCYFSENDKEFKQNIYILADDYFKTAYIIINDKKVKLNSTESSVSVEAKNSHCVKKFKNHDYEVIIDMHETGEIDETNQQNGIITIKSSDGSQVTKAFVGECGC